MRRKKYIVTGGTGMVGKHLQEIMPELLYLSSADCDLTDDQAVQELFLREKPYGVIHLAAKVGGIVQNLESPADFYDQNIKINSNTLIAAKHVGTKRFLGVLSTCMYPSVVENYPMLEEDIHAGAPPESNFSYAYAKRCMAVQIEAYRQQHSLKYNYIIPCNLYGENDDFADHNKSHFVTALLKKIHVAETTGRTGITLFGSGRPMRQFMHSADLARVIKKIIEGDITESFNVAPPDQNYSIAQMARLALDVLGKENWNILYDSSRPDGQFRKDVGCQKMRKLLGPIQFTGFEEGVLKVYNKIKEENTA